YRRDNDYRLVVNCATREKDLAWLATQADGFAVEIVERPELAMIAVQGPQARTKFAAAIGADKAAACADLKVFGFVEIGDWMIARTGYTGEDGVEVMLPAEQAVS